MRGRGVGEAFENVIAFFFRAFLNDSMSSFRERYHCHGDSEPSGRLRNFLLNQPKHRDRLMHAHLPSTRGPSFSCLLGIPNGVLLKAASGIVCIIASAWNTPSRILFLEKNKWLISFCRQ